MLIQLQNEDDHIHNKHAEEYFFEELNEACQVIRFFGELFESQNKAFNNTKIDL